MTDKELYAVYHFVTAVYSPFLRGRKFTVITDHQALRHMLKNPIPQGRTARQIAKLMQYDFEIKYRSGKSHQNADTLSRLPPNTTPDTPRAKVTRRLPAGRQ